MFTIRKSAPINSALCSIFASIGTKIKMKLIKKTSNHLYLKNTVNREVLGICPGFIRKPSIMFFQTTQSF